MADNGQENQKQVLTINQKRSVRASIIAPLILSLIFCITKWIIPISGAIQDGSEIKIVLQNLSNYPNLIDIFIDYFATTIISSVSYLLLQEYIYRVTSYLNENNNVLLIVLLLVYIVLYVVYISGLSIFKWILLVYTILFVVVLWRSLRADIKQKDLPFSGNSTG